MSALFDSSGRIAIVTGGAGLLAPEYATALSDHGATVILADVNKDKCDEVASSLAANGIKAISRRCDISSVSSWKELLLSVMNEFGTIDILVNNAAFTNQN